MAKYEDFLDLLTEKEAAVYLHLTNPRTLTVWRSTGRYGIPYVKLGRIVMYRKQDLADFLESCFIKVPSLPITSCL
jgi:hypothetical protein